MRWAVVFWSVARWIWGAIDLYGGIDGEALETPRPLSPVSFGPASQRRKLLAVREFHPIYRDCAIIYNYVLCGCFPTKATPESVHVV